MSRIRRHLAQPLLLALLSAYLALPGCAFGRCELGKLPSIIQSVVVDVTAIAMRPAGYVAALTDLANQLAPGQVDCAAQAIVDAAQPKPGAQLAPMSPEHQTAVAHLREYLDVRRASGVILRCAAPPLAPIVDTEVAPRG